jgi:hypothetical protein
MAITVFDAVGKFFADTSNLDEFIVKLEQGLTGASEKAALSTQVLKSAQVEFRDAIKAVSAEGGNTAENMERLAQAEKNLALATAAARQEHAALRAELTQTKEATGVAAQATEELTGKLTSMFGLIAAFEGFRRLIEGTQQSVLNLELLSQKTGIAIDTLAGIEHVSEAAGVKIEEVSTALTRLARAQALAIEGGKQQIAAFERIGISATELKNLSPEQLFYRVADAMANSSSHAAAAASAFALLGRGGAALIPIFQQNTEVLRAQIEAAAKNSAVTAEAGESAREWEKQIADITESFRAGMIPIMQAAVPVIKGVETGVSGLSLVIRDLAAIVGGAALGIFNSFKGMGTLISDTLSGDWKKLAVDARAVGFEVQHDFAGIGVQFKDNWQHTTEAIKETWTKVNPLKQAKDDLSELGNTKGNEALHKFLEAQIQAEKQAADAEVDLQLQKNRALLGAAQLTFAEELKLQGQANAAKYDNAKKALNDQLELALSQGEKSRAQATKIIADLDKLETERQAKSLKNWTDFQKELQHIMSQPIPLVNTIPPGMETIQNEITKGFDQARAAAKALGITLHIDLVSSVQAAYANYEKLLQLLKQGIVTQKDADNGYIKLVKAELDFAKASGASAKAVEKLTRDLAQLEGHVDKVKTRSKDYALQLRKDMQEGASAWQDFGDTAAAVADGVVGGIGNAFAALISGQESFGQAFEKQVAQTISQAAGYWAKYFAGLAIADAFANPAKAAAELAAAIALEALSGVLGAVASSGGGSSHSASSSGGGTSFNSSSPNVSAGSGPTQVVNVTHFATGGIASHPMFAMVAEDSEEAIIPLHDQNAIEKIAAAFMDPIQRLARLNPNPSVPSSLIYPTAHQGAASASSISGLVGKEDIRKLTKAIENGLGEVHVHLHGSLPALATELSHLTKTGRVRLHATTTDKTIRKA